MMKSTIKIGPIDRLLLFGGGPLMVAFAKEAIKRKIKTTLFAVKRHLEEALEGGAGPTLREVLEKEKIPFFHADDINRAPELPSVVSGAAIGIGLGEAYTFSKETIALFQGKLFDFMTIRLPQYRGGAHFTWQILRKNRIGCWNIQLINEAMIPGAYDSGEILKTREYFLPPSAKIPNDYYDAAHEEGFKLFCKFLDEVQAGKEFGLAKLQENFSSYFPRLHTLRHGWINWSWNCDEIETMISAFDDPYPGASTFLNGRRVFLKQCQADAGEGMFHPFMSGLIYRMADRSVFIATREGALMVRKVSDEKGRDLIPTLKVGQRFFTPMKVLEEAMQYSAEYDAAGLVEEQGGTLHVTEEEK
ncbi:MAG: hypothetical protein LLH30_18205 [Candidatus Manganitrophus sp. SA1]|nr:hypothetical protein [Candidatus Manganitrophus morganii]